MKNLNIFLLIIVNAVLLSCKSGALSDRTNKKGTIKNAVLTSLKSNPLPNSNTKSKLLKIKTRAVRFMTNKEAARIAKTYINERDLLMPDTRSQAFKLDMVCTDLSLINNENSKIETPAFYIYNIGDEGYIIVSTQRIEDPILAYSIENNFNSEAIPQGLSKMLDIVKSELVFK